jgi:hypothetical protein
METRIVFDALEKFIKGRSGIDWRDYGHDFDGRKSFRAEVRSITKDRKEALAALAEARELTPRYDVLMDAFRAFSGRLTWNGERLEYCTGQYYPTEYRKAARAVLNSYISGCKAATAKEQPREYIYNSIADVKRANAESGGHWFDRDTMRYFKTRIETGIVKCGSVGEGAAHRFTRARFVSSEQGPHDHSPRAYTIREAQPDGGIDTVGEFQQYKTLRAAKAAILTGGR